MGGEVFVEGVFEVGLGGEVDFLGGGVGGDPGDACVHEFLAEAGAAGVGVDGYTADGPGSGGALVGGVEGFAVEVEHADVAHDSAGFVLGEEVGAVEVYVVDFDVGDFLAVGEDEAACVVDGVEFVGGELVEGFDGEFGHGFQPTICSLAGWGGSCWGFGGRWLVVGCFCSQLVRVIR